MIISLEHHITDHCNLNCAGCSHFSPLCKPWTEDLETFKKEWSIVYDKKLQIRRIRILGGEPLLNPDLDKMLIYLRSLFPDSDINVVTNGILLKQQKPKLLPIFQKNNISITISVYPGLGLDLQNILYGFPKIEVYNKAQFWNISLQKESTFIPKNAFQGCFSATDAHCSYLKNGRIYPCPILPNIPHLIEYFPELKNFPIGKVDVEEGGITIKDHSIEEIESFLTKENQICSFCNVWRAKQPGPWHRTNYELTEWMEIDDETIISNSRS